MKEEELVAILKDKAPQYEYSLDGDALKVVHNSKVTKGEMWLHLDIANLHIESLNLGVIDSVIGAVTGAFKRSEEEAKR